MRLPLRRDPSGVSNLIVIFIAAIVVAGVLGWYATTIARPPSPPAALHRIERGDSVRVDYIGYFEDGSGVFDTSVLSVAEDNATWPKAITYSWRTEFSPLGVTQVGNRSVIAGFDDGLVGMTVGETKSIVVPPALGYGVANPALLVHRSLLQEVPVREEMNETAFRARYTVAPTDGMTLSDPLWNWTVAVSVSGNVVTVTHSPFVGEAIRPYGAWSARVDSIDDTANGGVGVIRVRHILTPSDVGRRLIHDGSKVFAIAGLDLGAGQFIVDYNFRGQGTSWIWIGKVMVFQVTVVGVTT